MDIWQVLYLPAHISEFKRIIPRSHGDLIAVREFVIQRASKNRNPLSYISPLYTYFVFFPIFSDNLYHQFKAITALFKSIVFVEAMCPCPRKSGIKGNGLASPLLCKLLCMIQECHTISLATVLLSCYET